MKARKRVGGQAGTWYRAALLAVLGVICVPGIAGEQTPRPTPTPYDEPGGGVSEGHCGDGRCRSNESRQSCPADCDSTIPPAQSCGGETGASCEPYRIGTTGRAQHLTGPAASCPAGFAIASLMMTDNGPVATCEPLPPEASCGDGICGLDETEALCPEDCFPGAPTPAPTAEPTATPTPTPTTTPTPAPTPAGCGNGICTFGETFANCSADCRCGNGVCDMGESALFCPGDCL